MEKQSVLHIFLCVRARGCLRRCVRARARVCVGVRVRGNAHVRAHVYPCLSSMQRVCATLSFVASLPAPYFSILSRKRHDFREEVNEKMRVSILSTTLSEYFLILTIIQ